MQNLVADSHAVCSHVGPKKCWRHYGPAPGNGNVVDSPTNILIPKCLHRKFGH